MTSDEKRREVAAELRRQAAYCDGSLSEWWQRLQDTVTGEVDFADPKATFRAIADLIDCQTCNMDVIATGEQADYECSEHIMYCARCGAEFGYVLYSEDGSVSTDDKPNYCPNCRAEVIDD